MNYKTLLVHLELDRSNEGVLGIASTLADTLHAEVIGVAACQPVQIFYGEVYVSEEIYKADREEIERQIGVAEQEFRKAFAGRARILDWRAGMSNSPLSDYVVDQARSADLVITGTGIDGSIFDYTRRVNIADLVMQAGRPVLIVPNDRAALKLDHIVVGWKGTRESRLAIMEALPLLKLAGRVTVVEIAPVSEISRAELDLEDVAGWLRRHGIEVVTIAIPAKGEDGSRLAGFAAEKGADLLVAGAYGHSRIREWILGGVTKDFLLRPNRCVIVAH